MAWKRRPPEGDVRRVESLGANSRGVIINKAGRSVQFASWAARGVMLRLDWDQDVRDYQSQPEQFCWLDGSGHVQKYVPDLLVWKREGSAEVMTVLCSQMRNNEYQHRRQLALEDHCRQRGWRYHVVAGQQLPDPVEVTNLLALISFRAQGYAHEQVGDTVRHYLRSGRATGLQELCQWVGQSTHIPPMGVFGAICHEIWHQRIRVDIKQRLIECGQFVPAARWWIEDGDVS